MKAGLLITGSEITRGLVQDKHTKNLSFILESLGISVECSVLVPDSKLISHWVSHIYNLCDLIIVTGGLGPTDDDMTRYQISDALNIPLVVNPHALLHVKTLAGDGFGEGSNARQAEFPQGFKHINNFKGTALGFYGEVNSKLVMALPGPPFEQEPMLDDVREILRNYAIKNRVLKAQNAVFTYTLFGCTEAHFNDLTARAFFSLNINKDELTVGTCYKEFRVILYLYTQNSSTAEKFASFIDNSLKEEYGISVVLKGDIDLFNAFADLLKSKGYTLSLAESITGGLLAKKITDIPGSSEFFKSGVVSYTNTVKHKVLKVKNKTIETKTEVSSECAAQMAQGACKLFKSDVSISLTGYAGPTGANVGLVYMAVKVKKSKPKSFCHKISGRDRIGVRNTAAVLAVLHAIELINDN